MACAAPPSYVSPLTSMDRAGLVGLPAVCGNVNARSSFTMPLRGLCTVETCRGCDGMHTCMCVQPQSVCSSIEETAGGSAQKVFSLQILRK